MGTPQFSMTTHTVFQVWSLLTFCTYQVVFQCTRPFESLFRGLQDWRSDAQTVFEYTSRSFQWIQVWTATWPLQKLYRVGLQPPGGSPAPMAWGSILQEDGATRDFNVCH